MYLECLLIARNKSQADQEVSNIMNTHAINTWSQLNINKQYRSTVRLNNKYLDSHQNQQSRNNNHRTAANLQPYKFHTVLVSPLRADLETCFDLFGENTNVQIYVDPALAPRVNSMAAASQDNSHLIKQFFVKPNLTKLEQNTHWFLTFGQKGRMGDESMQQFQKYLQNQSQFQSQAHFHQRIADFKKQLFVYSNQKNEKTGIIAHPQVLQVLSSTGLHQSFCLINSVKVDFGQSRSEFILIEGIQGEKQSTSLPFCQMLC